MPGLSCLNVGEPIREALLERHDDLTERAALSPACTPLLQQNTLVVEEKTALSKYEDASFSRTKSSHSISEATSDQDNQTFAVQITPKDLNDQQRELFDEIIQHMLQLSVSTTDWLDECFTRFYDVHVLERTFTDSTFQMIVECPTQESLNTLLNDCESGLLDEVAEKHFVNSDVKTILNLETVKLKTVIHELVDQQPSSRFTRQPFYKPKSSQPSKLSEGSTTSSSNEVHFDSEDITVEVDQPKPILGTLRTENNYVLIPQPPLSEDRSTPQVDDLQTDLFAEFQPIKAELEVKPQDLNAEQRQIFVDSVQEMDRLAAFVDNLRRSHSVLENTFTNSGLDITIECPSLNSLEKLLNDHETGRLNEVAKRYLVTEELKTVLSLENVRFESVFKEHSYLEILRIARLPNEQTKPSWRRSATRNDTTSKLQKALRGDLHRASADGDYETVKMLLECGEDVDQRDQFALTPLHLACWYGRESVVQLLLEHGANVDAVDRFQRTPLQKAERRSHRYVTQLLLERNAARGYKQPLSLKSLAQKAFLQMDNFTGFNLLQAAVFEGMYNIVFSAHVFVKDFVKEMDSEIVRNDLFPGMTAIEILSSLDIKGKSYTKIEKLYSDSAAIAKTFTELHWSAERDDPEMVVELCLNDGVDVNITAKSNRTPLRVACAHAPGILVETLIDLGADKNSQTSETKSSPLSLAASWNHYIAVRTLLDRGADVNIQSIDDNTPLHDSVSLGFCKMSQLLIEKGSNVNLRNKKSRTPLYIAVERNDLHLIKLLLENSADLGMEYQEDPEDRVYLVRGNKKGKPVWYYVLVDKHLLGLFLKRTNEGSVDVADFGAVLRSGRGKDPPDGTIDHILKEKSAMLKKIPGETLLHVTGRNNSTEAIDLLVNNGTWDRNPRDAEGFTPLHIAAIRGNMKAVEKLVDLGADAGQAEAVADFAHINEEYEIEKFLKSKIGFLPKRNEQVELYVRLTNFFNEARCIGRELGRIVVESVNKALK